MTTKDLGVDGDDSKKQGDGVKDETAEYWGHVIFRGGRLWQVVLFENTCSDISGPTAALETGHLTQT